MKSYTCKEDRHQDCAKVLIDSSNKRFRCDCGCHPKEVKRIKVEDEVEDED
jgi:Cft2 family RNA processing exonuclease